MFGMRGTGDWVTDQRPKSWRELILFLYPNGSAPLTAILSKMGEEKVDDPQYYWWTKLLQTQRAATTGIYSDVALSGSVSTSAAAGVTAYMKMAAAAVVHFRIGHVVMLRDASNYGIDVNAKVTSVVTNGDDSYVACKLLEAANSAGSDDIQDVDTLLVIGNLNPEGGSRPDAIAYDPVKWNNYTQIFRTPLSITRTARLTHLRTGDAYKEAKRECLELHSIEMEKAFLWGIASENTGANGKPERSTWGIVRALQYGSDGTANVGVASDYTRYASGTDPTDHSGQTWLQGGEDWLDEQLERMFRYGRPEKLAFAGSGALLGINRLAKAGGQIQLTAESTVYGIKVLTWITPFGIIRVKTHPLFSFETTNRNSMLIFEPEDIKYRYITDTMFRKAPPMEAAQVSIDGTDEEYLTECGLEFHHPNGWGWLNGLNTDNTE